MTASFTSIHKRALSIIYEHTSPDDLIKIYTQNELAMLIKNKFDKRHSWKKHNISTVCFCYQRNIFCIEQISYRRCGEVVNNIIIFSLYYWPSIYTITPIRLSTLAYINKIKSAVPRVLLGAAALLFWELISPKAFLVQKFEHYWNINESLKLCSKPSLQIIKLRDSDFNDINLMPYINYKLLILPFVDTKHINIGAHDKHIHITSPMPFMGTEIVWGPPIQDLRRQFYTDSDSLLNPAWYNWPEEKKYILAIVGYTRSIDMVQQYAAH